MRGAVDAVRAARDDRDAAAREVGGQLERHMVAIGGRGPRADERDGGLQPAQRRGVAAHPEAQRRVLLQIVELTGPLRGPPRVTIRTRFVAAVRREVSTASALRRGIHSATLDELVRR